MTMYGVSVRRPTRDTGLEGGAKQSFKEECDINFIMRKYRTSGLVTHIAQNRGRFADVSEVGSYQEAITRVRDTHEFFSKLPASMRAQFGNEPSVFLDFIGDSANREAVVDLGIEEVLEPPVKAATSPPVKEEVEDV